MEKYAQSGQMKQPFGFKVDADMDSIKQIVGNFQKEQED